MNDFLDQHGYRLYHGNDLLLIRHYNPTTGCVHAIFIFIILALFCLSIFLYYVSHHYVLLVLTILVAIAYIIEIERRKKQVSQVLIDFKNSVFKLKKGKSSDDYQFKNVIEVVNTSEHLGGYATAERSTTEEYRRDINVLFNDGFVLTVFSIISDHEEAEPEIEKLTGWLMSLCRR